VEKTRPASGVDLVALLRAREPLVYWSVTEEERALALLKQAASDEGLSLRTWSCLKGLDEVPESEDLVVALRTLLDEERSEVLVLADVDSELERPQVLRGLRDLARREGQRTVILLGRLVEVPPELRPEAVLLTQPPPTREDILQLLRERVLDLPFGTLSKARLGQLASLGQGLPLRRVRRIVDREVRRGGDFESLRAALLDARREAIREIGVLELVAPLPQIDDLGGLDGLKEWLTERRELFSHEIVEAGLPVPRGILLMGVSGCGKSLAAKACASLWELPLYRLDMNLVFSNLHGSPEAAFHRALTTLEAAAPLVLWIDELENGLGARGSGGVAAPDHLFSAFLTWLQEKPPLVFVAATANRIELLPAEILRKGRFDQVFFLDLPSETERRAILAIHLRRHGVTVGNATLDYLVYDTRGWSGAELEQAVIAARVRATAHSREPEREDLIHAVQSSVPLSRTMREQVRALREWAYGRAVSASREEHASLGTNSELGGVA
jgi:hypothetical protein